MVLRIITLSNKAGRTTLTISGVDNFHSEIASKFYNQLQRNSRLGNTLNVKF